jgi:hypothetical protein
MPPADAALAQPEATQPPAALAEAALPEATAPEATAPEATAPEAPDMETAAAEAAAPETAATEAAVSPAQAVPAPTGEGVSVPSAGAGEDADDEAARLEKKLSEADLPVPGYDSLSLPSLRARLRSLDAAQVGVLVEYERSHAGRADVVAMFERRIAKLAAGG